jgi:hypothetical protein
MQAEGMSRSHNSGSELTASLQLSSLRKSRDLVNRFGADESLDRASSMPYQAYSKVTI